ncbi:endolysin [Pectobacterium phage Possum]|uniref:Lysozyme n=1 Tax=Pectobacterium phage Possum TaxID=2686301 RepID=A0A7T0LVQ2_9CAUD|nr:endolysin [Pectobacterium phage Possum]QPL10906.1 lysozyme [Pectobacterium phage Possum]QPL11008.1 lysozyme [Pectobacterium phage Horatius]
MTMKMSAEGKKVTKYFESLKLKAYPDPATGGKPWTIAYGHTGPDVYSGLVINETMAEKLLDLDLAKAEAQVNKYAHDLTQGQFDCLVDMVFNMGSGFIRPDNIKGDFDDFLVSGNKAEMRKRIPQFRMAAGKVMKGLVRRRAANVALWDGKSGDEAIKLGVAAA